MHINMRLIKIQNFQKYLVLNIDVQSHEYETFDTKITSKILRESRNVNANIDKYNSFEKIIIL